MKNKKTLIIVGAVIGVLVMCCATTVFIASLFWSSSTDSTVEEDPSIESSYDSSDFDSELEEDSSVIRYNESSSFGSLWVGSLTESRASTKQIMHATYTFYFNYEIIDEDRTVKSVEVTDITANTSLPSGDLYVIPFAHVSISENGGSVVSVEQHEDWNTYGYVYAADYLKMKSLGSSYSPNICEERMFCDYLDEVGRKGGEISLRFKYMGVGNKANKRPGYEAINVIKAHGVTANQLSGSFSWVLNVTLDDNTTETKTYNAKIDGTSLDLGSSNTMSIPIE